MPKREDDFSSLFKEDLHGITENAVFPDHVNEFQYRPRTLVDETLEIIDPTPNVHTMFVQFNEKYFWNQLSAIQVKWSNRMTRCAGVCSFHPRNRECIIALSAPLLKLRPRKDLVETLLHEMIHGYLFMTNNNRDRDGHGPEFCKHMHRINREAGTKISIYHDFHDEVRVYQQHWWRCNGPCQKRPPFYGTVRRAMNRAPGPSDSWWLEHKSSCDGQFIKIREPEKPSPKSKAKPSSKIPPGQNTLDKYIISPKNDKTQPKSDSYSVPKHEPPNNISPGGFTKLGTASNNVYGFGTGGPGSGSSNSGVRRVIPPYKGTVITPAQSPSAVHFSGTVGGSLSGRSKLLDLYDSPPQNSQTSASSYTTCPVCNQIIPMESINIHLDDCIDKVGAEYLSPKRPKLSDDPGSPISLFPCPICSQIFPTSEMSDHTDLCFLKADNAIGLPPHKKTEHNSNTTCPVCNQSIPMESINIHLDNCIDKSEALYPSPKRPKLSDNSRSATTLWSCPMCFQSFPTSERADHIYLCVTKDGNATSLPPQKKTEHNSKNTNLPNSSSKFIKCISCDARILESDINNHLDMCLFLGDNNEAVHKNTRDNQLDLTSSPVEYDTDSIRCPTCSRRIGISNYPSHAVECLARERKTKEDAQLPTISLDRFERPNSPINSYKCVVCSAMIAKSISLEEHLETCIAQVYHGSNDDSPIDSPVAGSTEKGSSTEKHFCPICMNMIEGSKMEAHVDHCIATFRKSSAHSELSSF